MPLQKKKKKDLGEGFFLKSLLKRKYKQIVSENARSFFCDLQTDE